MARHLPLTTADELCLVRQSIKKGAIVVPNETGLRTVQMLSEAGPVYRNNNGYLVNYETKEANPREMRFDAGMIEIDGDFWTKDDDNYSVILNRVFQLMPHINRGGAIYIACDGDFDENKDIKSKQDLEKYAKNAIHRAYRRYGIRISVTIVANDESLVICVTKLNSIILLVSDETRFKLLKKSEYGNRRQVRVIGSRGAGSIVRDQFWFQEPIIPTGAVGLLPRQDSPEKMRIGSNGYPVRYLDDQDSTGEIQTYASPARPERNVSRINSRSRSFPRFG